MTTATLTSHETIVSAAVKRFSGSVRTFWNATTQGRQKRRAVEHFRRMTDQQLRDIGIQRHEIFTMVYGTNTNPVHHYTA